MSFFTYITFWLSAHRALMLALLAAIIWVLAQYWYLRRDIEKWKRRRRPRRWSADMATKTSKGGFGPPQ